MGLFSIIMLIFSFLLAYFIGRERRIGFGWSFLLSFTLPLVGGFLTVFSKEPGSKPRKRSVTLMIIGVLSAFSAFKTFLKFLGEDVRRNGWGNIEYVSVMPSFGLFVLFLYLFFLGFASDDEDDDSF